MNKKNLDNKALDMIGRKLIEGDGQRSADIDKIVANPRLYNLVGKKIAANAMSPAGVPPAFFRRNAAAFAGVMLILIAAIAVVRLSQTENAVFTSEQTQVPEPVPEEARPVIPPQGIVNEITAGRAFNTEFHAEAAVVKPVSKKINRKRQTQSVSEPDDDFYALAFGGDETTDWRRIVRVDVPRSSLFAIGVNVPLENGPDIVKADLLVGSDGVAHAIRVVK